MAKKAAHPDETIFQKRFDRFYDELKWLYCELYADNPYVMMHLNDLCDGMKQFYLDRSSDLHDSDIKREADPAWYKRNDLLGMMMYVIAFSGTLKKLEDKPKKGRK